jgi:hypothetical protein
MSGIVMRLERSSSFLKTLHIHSKLLNEIALKDNHRVKKEEMLQLISSIYGFNQTNSEVLIVQLSETSPESMLTFETPFYTLEKRIAELFRWLSKNVRLQSHHSLSGIVAEIKDATERIVDVLDNNLEHSKFQIQSSIDTIEYRTNELVRISTDNSSHISDILQKFKEGVVERDERAYMAQILLSDYLAPMLELIRPEGSIEVTFVGAKTSLERIQSLYAFPTDIREAALRVIRKQRIAREKLQEIHQLSFTNFVPILQSYIRRTSVLLSGATSGIRAISTYGWKAIPSLKDLKNLRAKRPRNILPDSGFKSYTMRQIQNQSVHQFTPGSSNSFIPELEIDEVLELLGTSKIEDLLKTILDNFPDYSLTDCNRVATDILIQIGERDKLLFSELELYSRHNESLEVRKVAVL